MVKVRVMRMSVVFASSREEDCNEVFTDSCSEAQDCSDNMTPTSCRRFCIDSNIIPARPPRFEFKASLGAITVSFPLNNLSFLTLTLMMNFFVLPWRDKLACPSAAEFRVSWTNILSSENGTHLRENLEFILACCCCKALYRNQTKGSTGRETG